MHSSICPCEVYLCSYNISTHTQVDMLQLMLGRYSDPIVREYAVRELNKMSDNVLKEYLLQLVQTLKYEPYHDSPLLRMILRRALKNPNKIGHTLFWLLRSEMHVSDVVWHCLNPSSSLSRFFFCSTSKNTCKTNMRIAAY